MAYQQLLRDWNRGVLALEKGNLDAALDIFCSIKNPPSKIDFNIGCLYLQQGNLIQALEVRETTFSATVGSNHTIKKEVETLEKVDFLNKVQTNFVQSHNVIYLA
uniref:Tetratricopeptide repeat protein n=1 Tax=Laticauda laticaudata TaxID=8630 RepID=A0A8C5SUG0_LATLA